MTTDSSISDSIKQSTVSGVVLGGVSENSPTDSSPTASKQHKRTYQACEPCRNRKVRCDLGSVDAPSDPPCLRCRREKKHCYFTETRRKRKAGESGAPDPRDYENSRRSSSFHNGFSGRGEHLDGMGGYNGAPELLAISKADHVSGSGQPDSDEVRNDTAAALFQQPIHQPGDALRLLVDAASRTETMSSGGHHPHHHHSISHRSNGSGDGAGGSSGGGAGTNGTGINKFSDSIAKDEGSSQTSTIDPAIVKMSDLSDPEQAKSVALQTWARLRYVRAGWFTPIEGMAYLEYFSAHLSNLTPTLVPDFSDCRTHIKLLTEEPMMTVTLLTIASRYKKLAGPAGFSRAIYIHSMLWRECQDMVTRMFWGQEHFGGSFGLAGGYRADSGDTIKRGLRGLGTVEALLLLSEWHPRSMHFPPAAGNDDILAPLQSEWEEDNHIMQSRNPHRGWTEPAMRSDRMSWSLVGAAYNLAVELGVFDSMPELGFFRPGYPTRAYDPVRADRIGRLVHIYVSQVSGRLGYPNMLPHQGTDMNLEFFRLKIGPSEDESDPDFKTEQMQRAWCELTAIMRRVNNEIFRSKQQTLELIQSKEYIRVLESFCPDLREWLQRVESIELPDQTRTIVMMEYEYLRTYINSLALQAQIEQYAELASKGPSTANPEDKALFSSRQVEISKQNAPFIAEVVDATRGLLCHVVDGLQPSGGLRHSPVRTSFRILSGAMFLLKTFCLGSKETDIRHSFNLLHRTVNALRSTVVDDCHLSMRIADLLQSLIAAVGTKFVRVPIYSKSGHSKRHRASLSSKPGNVNVAEAKPESPVLGKPRTQDAQREGRNGTDTDLPFEPPVVNPNDPNIMIAPPPDYVYSFSEHVGGQHGSSNSSGMQQQMGYPPGTFGGGAVSGTKTAQSQMQSQSSHPQGPGLQSPTMQSNGPVSSQGQAIHPPMKFSPVQQNQQPFSPISNGSSNGAGGNSYDWFAMDINPLLHPTSASGPGGGGQAGSVGGASMLAWGNMFGPEIGDNLEIFNTLAADGLGFDDGVGTWSM